MFETILANCIYIKKFRIAINGHLYSPVPNAFGAGKSITMASGRGGPGNRDFFGPCEMALSSQESAIQDPTKLRFPGPNPLPLAQVMDFPASKALCTEDFIDQSPIVIFKYMSFLGP